MATLLDPKKLFYCETENRLLFFKFCWKITEKAKNQETDKKLFALKMQKL